MDLFSVLEMIGGLALFLFGMNVMSDGLAKASGGKLERILEKLTDNPIKAVVLGAGVTAVIQSSSATTVMVVGFVNSGIMKLTQAIGVIMGANIGTTVTSWILSLSSLESSNFFVKLLKPTSFSPVLAMVGVIFIMFCKSKKKKDIGSILIGFAILMTGMDTMSGAVKPLANVPEFTGILTMFSNPLLGVLTGAVLTAVIQSSSASVGILQALCVTGAVTYSTAIPIIMGQNIGTCVTAMISAVGASKNAKRAAFVHLYFNLIGTILFMLAFYGINAVLSFSFLNTAADAAGIAVIHSVFNVVATLVLLPFSKVLERLACLTVKDTAEREAAVAQEKEFKLLDVRFLESPGFAIEQCRHVALQMAKETKESIDLAILLLSGYKEDVAERVAALEDNVDRYEDELGSYLVKLSSYDLSSEDSRSLSFLLHCIGDFERISDHAVSVKNSAKEVHDKKEHFSDKALAELNVYTKAIKDILVLVIESFETNNLERAKEVEPLEEAIDVLSAELKQRHIERLRANKCSIEMGFVLSDLINSFERVADHCSKIAASMIEISQDEFQMHAYLGDIKADELGLFQKKWQGYLKSYTLPK